jgi:tetratricopeptide (TPR) repeat protein
MTIAGDLDTLVIADVLRAVANTTDPEYEFRHALLREAAYQEILKEDRAVLHRAVGEALERLYAGRLDEVVHELAFHFRRAGDRDKAVAYLQRSANLAAAGFANDEALDALAEVLELVGEHDPGASAIYERIGDIRLLAGRHEEALDAFGRASDLTDSTLDRARLGRKAGSCFPMGPDFDATLARLQRAADLLGDDPFGDPAAWWGEWLEVRLVRGFVAYFASGAEPERFSDLEGTLEETRVPLERWGNARQQARYVLECASPFALQRDGWRASAATLQLAHDGATAAAACGDARLLARATFVLGFTLLTRSELDAALPTLTDAARRAEGVGDVEWQCRSLVHLSIAARLAGDRARMKDALMRAAPLVELPGLALYRGIVIANQAWLSWTAGEPEGVAHAFDEALAAWAHLHFAYPFFAWIAAMPAIVIALEHDDLDTAVRHARGLTDSPSKVLPDSVQEAFRAAVAAADNGTPKDARIALDEGLAAAARDRYV